MEENQIEGKISEEKDWPPIGNHRSNSAENIITIVANTILILGIITAAIWIYRFGYTETLKYNKYSGEYDEIGKINLEALLISAIIFIASLVQWAFIKVIANISLNIKDINNKLK